MGEQCCRCDQEGLDHCVIEISTVSSYRSRKGSQAVRSGDDEAGKRREQANADHHIHIAVRFLFAILNVELAAHLVLEESMKSYSLLLGFQAIEDSVRFNGHLLHILQITLGAILLSAVLAPLVASRRAKQLAHYTMSVATQGTNLISVNANSEGAPDFGWRWFRAILWSTFIVIVIAGAAAVYLHHASLLAHPDLVLRAAAASGMMVLGIFAEIAVTFSNEQRDLHSIRTQEVLTPLLFSLVVFFGFWSQLLTGSSIALVLYTAFISGFSWRRIVNALPK